MADDNSRSYPEASVERRDVVRHLKESVANGRPWHIALLEAIGLWTCPEENLDGHHYRYLIDGEAFDWLLLAERLCQEVADAIPEDELLDLLFFGRLPEKLPLEEFKGLIGEAKYHAYLNFHYGVTVERFLLLAVEGEIHKERVACVLSVDQRDSADSYERLYGASQEALLWKFREEKGYRQGKAIALDQLQEFTYWLFKYRLKNCDKERVASDTKKGMDYLKRQTQANGIWVAEGSSPDVIDHAP